MQQSPPSVTVLFDFDGTIADTGPGIAASVSVALEELGRPALPPETLRKFVGPPLRESFEIMGGVEPERVEDAIVAYRADYSVRGLLLADPYDGIEDALIALRSNGFRLAVATSKPEPYAVRILTTLGLADYFDTICGATFDGSLGEKADVIEVALARLGMDLPRYGLPDDGEQSHALAPGIVMVGDREYDVLGAAEFVIPCVGAGWGYGSRQELSDAGAAVIIDTPADLPAAVATLSLAPTI